MRVGVAHHFGWAVAVTASADQRIVDRRRIALVEPGVAVAPFHSDGKALDDAAASALVAQVRASAIRATGEALDALAADVGEPILSLSLRAWSPDFPTDIAVLRRVPYEARADSVMYRQVLAESAEARGWAVHLFDAKDVEAQATRLLGAPLPRPPGPPWTKDHRIALAATVLAAAPR
ncbi:hypothetical protein [Cryptosporangium sp. NPDC048952]|uniref:hypothetical protein n=1 Tax=Cryptosporangium sp. NPDC048952 TaxID=3363961 RepID=UPI003720D032